MPRERIDRVAWKAVDSDRDGLVERIEGRVTLRLAPSTDYVVLDVNSRLSQLPDVYALCYPPDFHPSRNTAGPGVEAMTIHADRRGRAEWRFFLDGGELKPFQTGTPTRLSLVLANRAADPDAVLGSAGLHRLSVSGPSMKSRRFESSF